jgi:aminopeptidase
VERLGELVAGYSLGLRPGQVVRIDGRAVAAPLALAIYRSALRLGANPYTNLTLDGLHEILVAEGSDEQLEYISPVAWEELDRLDAQVTIWSEQNTRSFTRADEHRHGMLIASQRRLSNRRWERIAAGGMTWCGTLHPTQAHAQDADMSLDEYERFFFGACHAEADDPAAHWRGVAEALRARVDSLPAGREPRIGAPDTDLRVGVAGRTWIAADGRLNMPDGEVFTSPVESETEGEIRFTFPAIFNGREVDDVRLRFRAGRVVEAEAARGERYLRELLDLDSGASVLGEVAFGLNYEIDRFTRNILFDEKIGGTMHVALGGGFDEAGTQNTSDLHWDFICDLREHGEVYADGELIWRAGSFLNEVALAGA